MIELRSHLPRSLSSPLVQQTRRMFHSLLERSLHARLRLLRIPIRRFQQRFKSCMRGLGSLRLEILFRLLQHRPNRFLKLHRELRCLLFQPLERTLQLSLSSHADRRLHGLLRRLSLRPRRRQFFASLARRFHSRHKLLLDLPRHALENLPRRSLHRRLKIPCPLRNNAFRPALQLRFLLRHEFLQPATHFLQRVIGRTLNQVLGLLSTRLPLSQHVLQSTPRILQRLMRRAMNLVSRLFGTCLPLGHSVVQSAARILKRLVRRAMNLVPRFLRTRLPLGKPSLHRFQMAARLRRSFFQRAAQPGGSRGDVVLRLRQQILRDAVNLLVQLFRYARKRRLQLLLPAILRFRSFILNLRDTLFAQTRRSLLHVAAQFLAARPCGIISRKISSLNLWPIRQRVRDFLLHGLLHRLRIRVLIRLAHRLFSRPRRRRFHRRLQTLPQLRLNLLDVLPRSLARIFHHGSRTRRRLIHHHVERLRRNARH